MTYRLPLSPLSPQQARAEILAIIARATDVDELTPVELRRFEDRARAMGYTLSRNHCIEAFRLFAIHLLVYGRILDESAGAPLV